MVWCAALIYCATHMDLENGVLYKLCASVIGVGVFSAVVFTLFSIWTS